MPRECRSRSIRWPGQVGTWEIAQDRFYLVGIDGPLEDGSAVTLETFFRGFPDRVFAHWYSGTVRVPQGKMLKYVHAGYAAVRGDAVASFVRTERKGPGAD